MSQQRVIALIFFTIACNALGIFFPILRNDDAALYANIAKNIIVNQDWINLTFNNLDWLDKPHLPFWLTALSYKIFGIKSFAYILPGLLCHFIGSYYTYRFGKILYNKQTAYLAAVIYLTSFHLLISSIDVRAEAYLLAMITPASYYYYLYYKDNKLCYLVYGAIFSALAIMTKGLFVLVTIFSGIAAISLFNKSNFTWLKTFIFILIFILPELICLYLQFDICPNKVIFNATHVSGIKWFLWDSQFGRFFNTGPISRVGNNLHYLFFVHTFIWSILPWSILFITSVFHYLKKINLLVRAIYLLASFSITFILFSLTKFQLDYYINILIPFIAITLANYIITIKINKITLIIHQILFYLLTLIVIITSQIIFKFNFLANTFTIIAIIIVIVNLFSKDFWLKNIVYPSLIINLLFALLITIYGTLYSKYDVGYSISQKINRQILIVDYKVNSLTLDFYTDKYLKVANIKKLSQVSPPYYLLIQKKDILELQSLKYEVIEVVKGTTIENLMKSFIDKNSNFDSYLLLKVV